MAHTHTHGVRMNTNTAQHAHTHARARARAEDASESTGTILTRACVRTTHTMTYTHGYIRKYTRTEPHWPWSFTALTTPLVRQSTAAGAAASPIGCAAAETNMELNVHPEQHKHGVVRHNPTHKITRTQRPCEADRCFRYAYKG
jgi:hypothetical protein